MALTGEVDGGPIRHPLSIIDTLTAAHATSAICAALHGRQRHGRGDFIELCLLDTAISALGNVGMQYLTDGRVPTAPETAMWWARRSTCSPRPPNRSTSPWRRTGCTASSAE